MAKKKYDEVVEKVRSLSTTEKWRLRDLLDALLEPECPDMTEEEFAREMLRRGHLEQVPPPPTQADIERFEKYKLVEIEGEPLSETVMRERRQVAAIDFTTCARSRRTKTGGNLNGPTE